MNLSRDHQSIHLSYRPKIISMTVTSRCNLRCVMCDQGVREVEKQNFDAALIGNMGDFISTEIMRQPWPPQSKMVLGIPLPVYKPGKFPFFITKLSCGRRVAQISLKK